KSEQAFGTGLCVDVALNTNTLTVGPRIFVEERMDYVGVRLNAANYFRRQESDFRIMPEIYFSFLGIVNIAFGYSVPLSTKAFGDISTYRFTITYNFIK